MADAKIASENISFHTSKTLLVVMITDPFSYLLEITSKKSSALYPGIFLNPSSSYVK